MTILIVTGIICLALCALFFWLNSNTPVQTCLPAIFLPVGVICLAAALGAWLL